MQRIKRNVIVDDIVVIGFCLKISFLYLSIQMHFENVKERENNTKAEVTPYFTEKNIHIHIYMYVNIYEHDGT